MKANDDQMFSIFIGYDPKEAVAYHTCVQSIIENTSIPVSITPLNLSMFKNYEEKHTDGSNAFIYSRFLIPYLKKFKGMGLFIDGDMIVNEDLKNLFDLYDANYAVQVVKHDYKPKNTTKMDGKVQEVYPRKNWSSCVLWNCSHPMNMRLDLKRLNSQSGMWHHRFMWLDDAEIGEIPHHWNYLTDWYKEPEDGEPKALHYTEGGPWFEHMKNCEYAEKWIGIRDEMFRQKGIV